MIISNDPENEVDFDDGLVTAKMRAKTRAELAKRIAVTARDRDDGDGGDVVVARACRGSAVEPIKVNVSKEEGAE